MMYQHLNITHRQVKPANNDRAFKIELGVLPHSIQIKIRIRILIVLLIMAGMAGGNFGP